MTANGHGAALAVAVHDVEQGSFERVVEIRQWLAEREVGRVTLLVIPAADQRPIGMHAPLALWLRDQVAHGDAVAQHGFAHQVVAPAQWPRRLLANWQAGEAAEFPGLGGEEAARRVASGRRLLGELDLDPHGFVAPGYAYTSELRRLLARSFDWFADLQCIRAGRKRLIAGDERGIAGDERGIAAEERGIAVDERGVAGPERVIRAPALCLGASTPLKRKLSPGVVRALGAIPGEVMRIDVHPVDFDHRGHVATLEWLLERAVQRQAVTYDELVD
jgi:predicted deacetylase